jgi:hypothetical protein
VTTQHPEAQPSANTVRQCRLFGGGLRRGGGGFNFQFNSYSRRGLSFYLFALGGFIGHHRLPATGCAAARRRRGVLVCCALRQSLRSGGALGPRGLGGCWGAGFCSWRPEGAPAVGCSGCSDAAGCRMPAPGSRARAPLAALAFAKALLRLRLWLMACPWSFLLLEVVTSCDRGGAVHPVGCSRETEKQTG